MVGSRIVELSTHNRCINQRGLAYILDISESLMSRCINLDPDCKIQEVFSKKRAICIVVAMQFSLGNAVRFMYSCGYAIVPQGQRHDSVYMEICKQASTATLEELNCLLAQLDPDLGVRCFLVDLHKED